jgi:NAD(P)-dependent dehydrogenase (short-subunit alcohol dehydrogenase family)
VPDMKLHLKRLSDQIIVITGASSGIGLTTGELAAAAGARVVMASRNERDLLEAVKRIRARGGKALHIVADVANPDAVDAIGAFAIEQFGGFDTWVNNAGIGMYGKLTETPLADKRRLFDVDFWGVVHGCRTAVRHLRKRGGAIINVGSVASDQAAPLLGIYSAAKHAVKGYTDVLRMELERDGFPISVSIVKPASINTPFIEHARSHRDAEPELIPPVYAPEEAARAILRCAEHPIRDVLVGGSAKVISGVGKMAPRAMDGYPDDALYVAQREGRRVGFASHRTMKTSAYTRVSTSKVGRALPLFAAGAIVAGVAFRWKGGND